jgi:hypothetical protein
VGVGRLHLRTRVGLAGHAGRLGFLHAHILRISRQVVALLAGDGVRGLRLGNTRIVQRLLAGLVGRGKIRLGDFFPPGGFGHADVLGIACEGRTAGPALLAVGRDAILLHSVFVLRHGLRQGGRAECEGDRQCDSGSVERVHLVVPSEW